MVHIACPTCAHSFDVDDALYIFEMDPTIVCPKCNLSLRVSDLGADKPSTGFTLISPSQALKTILALLPAWIWAVFAVGVCAAVALIAANSRTRQSSTETTDQAASIPNTSSLDDSQPPEAQGQTAFARREQAERQRRADQADADKRQQQAQEPAAAKRRSETMYNGFTESELERVYAKLRRAGYSSEDAILTTKSMLDYPDTRAGVRQWLKDN